MLNAKFFTIFEENALKIIEVGIFYGRHPYHRWMNKVGLPDTKKNYFLIGLMKSESVLSLY